jgi:hypothetical protein
MSSMCIGNMNSKKKTHGWLASPFDLLVMPNLAGVLI